MQFDKAPMLLGPCSCSLLPLQLRVVGFCLLLGRSTVSKSSIRFGIRVFLAHDCEARVFGFRAWALYACSVHGMIHQDLGSTGVQTRSTNHYLHPRDICLNSKNNLKHPETKNPA